VISILQREGMVIRSLDFSSIWIIRVGVMSNSPFSTDVERSFLALDEDTHLLIPPLLPDFDFSHIITELSFGLYYPGLLNSLDKTSATTNKRF
jgi:hypothetical protein